MRRDAEWFINPRTGVIGMAGWGLTAILTLPTGSRLEDPEGVWISLGICPRCHVLVLAETKHAFGDQRYAHERWHAATDHPIPADLAAEAAAEVPQQDEERR